MKMRKKTQKEELLIAKLRKIIPRNKHQFLEDVICGRYYQLKYIDEYITDYSDLIRLTPYIVAYIPDNKYCDKLSDLSVEVAKEKNMPVYYHNKS